MKTNWDYTKLADAYLKRPDYAPSAINEMFKVAELKKGDLACDVGAGVAHLTLELNSRGLDVEAVEPNDAMRTNGIERTKNLNIKWFEGSGENTGRESSKFDIVTFGSSFNVCDRQLALKETSKILKPNGWFACMWNHRDIETNTIQKEIEKIIKNNIEGYGYGTRRENQNDEINKSGLFGDVTYIEGKVTHSKSIEGQIEAWKSHATLERQAGSRFYKIIDEIEQYLRSLGEEFIDIDYTTRLWMAKAIN